MSVYRISKTSIVGPGSKWFLRSDRIWTPFEHEAGLFDADAVKDVQAKWLAAQPFNEELYLETM